MAGLFLFIIAIICPFLGLVIAMLDLRFGDGKRWRTDIVCISIFFANLSYCYIPENNRVDLFRYLEYFHSLYGLSLVETLMNAYRGSNLYAFNFLIWLGNAIDDVNIIPAISVFTVYFICFFVSCKVCQNEGYNYKYAFIYVCFAIISLDWYSLTNNVRNIMAFAIIGYAIFRDVYQKKRDALTILSYIIPIFIHQTAVLFVLVRCTLWFLKSKKLKKAVLAMVFLVNPIVQLLYSNISRVTSSPFILYIVSKAYNYLFDTSSAYGLRVQNSSRSFVARVLYLSLVAIVCIIIYKGYLEKENDNKAEESQFDTYVLITGLVALSCMFMLRPEYWRFSATVIVFGGAAVIPFLRKPPKDLFDQTVKLAYPFLAVACGMISWYQVLWTDLSQLLTDALVSIPVLNAVQDIIHIIQG